MDSPLTQRQQRRQFIHHLQSWSCCRRTYCNFRGQIVPLRPASSWGLGQPIICEIRPEAQTYGTSPSIQVQIRLFNSHGYYRMVMRAGSGWECEKDWFIRQFLVQRRRQRNMLLQYHHYQLRAAPKKMTRACDDPINSDFVTIRPLFGCFRRLPIELQQKILAFAIDRQERVSPGIKNRANGDPRCPTSTLFKLSNSVTYHTIPWVYRTTTFCFAQQHLTDFLYRIGPCNRSHLRKLGFAFDSTALTHCVRWFVPDKVFELLGPPLNAQMCFWRCLIRDLLKDLTLAEVNIEVGKVLPMDVEFVVKSLVSTIGRVNKIRFMRYGQHIPDVEAGPELDEQRNWLSNVQKLFERHCRGPQSHAIFSQECRNKPWEVLETKMLKDWDFFGT
ncbi:hypothetical protein AOQ84DRAFT_314166 [Glonium stellatum]|uniref:Uncharacterized protein n=1 Tax=Glonium stellatum TaxID=574774 RepID=A0A8E2JVJ1_9PEZI|nr:hypothetical protein AOQ84DRAFT_314166 [Glonium stellatum]